MQLGFPLLRRASGLTLRGLAAAILPLVAFLPATAHAQGDPRVVLHTSKGDIVLELAQTKAPETVKNFLEYVQSGFYDGTIFHRVIDGFMIQGGGLTPDLQEKAETRTPIQNEADNGLTNDAYTVAMARTMDPHSASAQFFINVKDNGFLNHRAKTTQGWGYAVFGKVVEGQDVVDAIKGVATNTRGMYENVPTEPVTIEKAEVLP